MEGRVWFRKDSIVTVGQLAAASGRAEYHIHKYYK